MRMVNIKAQIMSSAGKNVGTHILLVKVYVGISSLENSLAVATKATYILTL